MSVAVTKEKKAPVYLGDARDHAWNLAVQMHDKQTDKDGKPYWTHLAAVWQNVVNLNARLNVPVEEGIENEIAAILHDVIEDTSITEKWLREWSYEKENKDDETVYVFTPRTVDLIVAVTKKSGENNRTTYTPRIKKAGQGAMIVKLGDLYHNTESGRLAKLTEYVRDRLKYKYVYSVHYFETALGLPPTYSEAAREEAEKNHTVSSSYDTIRYDKDGYRLMKTTSVIVGDEVVDLGKVKTKTLIRTSNGTSIYSIVFSKPGKADLTASFAGTVDLRLLRVSGMAGTYGKKTSTAPTTGKAT